MVHSNKDNFINVRGQLIAVNGCNAGGGEIPRLSLLSAPESRLD
jgi:hypothetical protein